MPSKSMEIIPAQRGENFPARKLLTDSMMGAKSYISVHLPVDVRDYQVKRATDGHNICDLMTGRNLIHYEKVRKVWRAIMNAGGRGRAVAHNKHSQVAPGRFHALIVFAFGSFDSL